MLVTETKLRSFIRRVIKENIEDNQYRIELITFSNEVLKHLSGEKYKYFTSYSEGHNMFEKPIEIAFLRSFRDGVDIRHVLKQCFEDNRENIADCVSKCERLWSAKADRVG